MGRFEVTAEKLRYDPETDNWFDDDGNVFIKNQFNPDSPQWINVTTDSWSTSYGGHYLVIDWDVLEKPLFVEALQSVAKEKLKHHSTSYVGSIRFFVNGLAPLLSDSWQDFGDISASDLLGIWSQMVPHNRITLREMYQQMVDFRIGGARADIAVEMRQWKARNEVQVLKDVLQWHETRGALTSSEEKVLRETLGTSGGVESSKEHATRIFGWLLLDTIKRPFQVLTIRKDGLREMKGKEGGSEWYVEIQPVKAQTGLPVRWWRISDQLAREIAEFGQREGVSELQERFDRLLVWNVPSLLEHGVISTADAKVALTLYIMKRRAISPRTGKLLHVTPLRIRHTGATRLAFQGVSRDIIQEILEHDSKVSAQAYIDAIGSEIIPAIEKAGRLMGNIFYELNRGFFQGRVIHNIGDEAPVVVPEATPTPIIVGVCSRDTVKDGVCPKHPFLSCYDGCLNFFAWDNPDPHGKALRYFEKEIARWEKSVEAVTGHETTRLVADRALQTYHRAAEAAKEVLSQIEQVKAHD